MWSLSAFGFVMIAMFANPTDRWTALGAAGVFALLHIGDQIGRSRNRRANQQESG